MSDATAAHQPDIENIRATLLDDLVTPNDYAAAIGKSRSTIDKMMARGELPIVKVGRSPYVVVSKAREALMAGLQQGHEPVRRGRPAKRAA